MSDKIKTELEKEILTAVDLQGSDEGASLNDIQKHLKSSLKNDMPSLESIQSALNNAVAKGLLSKLDNGKYKIKDSSKNSDSTAKDPFINDKIWQKKHIKDDVIESTEKEHDKQHEKENAEEVDRFADKVAQDANQNADSDTKSVGSSMTKQDTNVSRTDEDKVLTKLNKLHLKDNETKATVRRAEENAQEVKQPLDKSLQDANRNADSDDRKVDSSLTKKDINNPLSDDDEKTDKEKLIKGSKKDK